MSNNGVREVRDHHDEVLTNQSGVPPAVPITSLVVSVIALGVSLWAFRRTRQAERRSSYPRVSVQLTWRDAPPEALQPDATFDDFEYERRKNSLGLAIKSAGELGFEEMRARVRFRRPWSLRTVSTPWASVVIPDPEQDQAGQYSAYASQVFSPFGNWTVRKVGVELRAIEVGTVGLWARVPWHRRTLQLLSHRIAALEHWGQARRAQQKHGDWMESVEWAEHHNPWWWRSRRLRHSLIAVLDRRDPDTHIYATVQVAWRVAQHGGEVVRLAQRHRYRLSFERGAAMEGFMSSHRFSGASRVATADPRYRYGLHFPGGSSGKA
ncbi:hypothetical protein AB4043_24095 [Terriglobus sp. YAF25]|uniref:hypothetical protein n=1 Tax=Terriglobus sp. YAF25 TaxID=3233080 RepID=UPI003F985602